MKNRQQHYYILEHMMVNKESLGLDCCTNEAICRHYSLLWELDLHFIDQWFSNLLCPRHTKGQAKISRHTFFFFFMPLHNSLHKTYYLITLYMFVFFTEAKYNLTNRYLTQKIFINLSKTTKKQQHTHLIQTAHKIQNGVNFSSQ